MSVQQFDLLKKSAIIEIQADLEQAVAVDRALAQGAATTATTKATEADASAGTAATKAIEAAGSATNAANAYQELPDSEHATADAIAFLVGRIDALEKFITNGKFKNLQVSELSIVDKIKLQGSDSVIFGTSAPSITPDFIGQQFIDTTNKIAYDAVGTTNAGDWKPRTNA